MAMELLISEMVQAFEQGRLNRRELIQGLAAVAASSAASFPAFAQSVARSFRATAINHISYKVADYRKSRDFYSGILGMRIQHDNGHECELAFGDNILIVRNPDRGMKPRPGQAASGPPLVDHIAYTVEGWDNDPSVRPALKAELERLGLNPRHVFRSHAPITKGAGDSFIVSDPDGFPVQIGGEEQ
jgi:catechol 2,3-dioxygenase-like lactoylglutathione lyase family enzyme